MALLNSGKTEIASTLDEREAGSYPSTPTTLVGYGYGALTSEPYGDPDDPARVASTGPSGDMASRTTHEPAAHQDPSLA